MTKRGADPRGMDDPLVWMDFARNDLRMARDGIKHGYRLESLCFHAQQAAEKALKAVLVGRFIQFPKVHDVERLLDLLPSDLAPNPAVRKAVALTRYAEAGRYPHGFEDVMVDEYREAVALASTVLNWVEKVLKRVDPPGGTLLKEALASYRAKKSRRKRGRK